MGTNSQISDMSGPPSYEKSQAAYPGSVLPGYISQQQPVQYGYGPPIQQQYGGPLDQYGAPAQQYGYGAVPPSQVVIVPSPLQVGRDPVSLTCPHCQANITTDIRVEAGTVAWVSAGFLCAMSCCLLAWLPLCMPSLKDVTHRCPNCNALIGRFKAKL